MRRKLVLIAALAGLATTLWLATPGDAAPKVDLRDFMHVKLKQSQNVLEGLVIEDFAKVAKNAQDMSALTLDESWLVMTTPDYIEFSRKFREAADSLATAAKKHQLEKSTVAFNQVTTRCVECHKYVRGVRMAKAGE